MNIPRNEELSRANAQAEACAEKFSSLYDLGQATDPTLRPILVKTTT